MSGKFFEDATADLEAIERRLTSADAAIRHVAVLDLPKIPPLASLIRPAPA
jgi:hypothetical protein